MKFLNLTFVLLALSWSISFAQQIKNVSYAQEGKYVKLQYELTGNPTDRYFVALFSSVNNYSEPLLYVTGDIGVDIIPGKKEVVWDAKKELGNYKGQIRFKFKAKYIPLIEFTGIGPKTKFKKGKTYTITWSGGPESGTIQLDLLKDSEKVTTLASINNGGSWEWAVPKKMDKGIYRIRASANGREETSSDFKIAPKVPMSAILIPAAAVVGGVVFLIISQDSGSTNNDIPDPLKPS